MAENENQGKTVDLSGMTDDEIKDFIRKEIIKIVFHKCEMAKFIEPENGFQGKYLKELVDRELAELLFRKAMLTRMAKEQGETLVCPQCKTPVPSMPMTWLEKNIGGGSCELWRYCTLCETEFKPEENKKGGGR